MDLNHEIFPVHFGRALCADPDFTRWRVWLVTNGIGGFAAGTVANQLSERYHGLLIAALQPPLGRTLLAAKFDETVTYRDQQFSLFRNLMHTGRVQGNGETVLERFWLDGSIPTWLYALGDARLEKRIWMQHGQNTTYVQYRLVSGSAPLTLVASLLANDRDYHGATRAPMPAQVTHHAGLPGTPPGLCVTARPEGTPLFVHADRGEFFLTPGRRGPTWTAAFRLLTEIERGFEGRERHLRAAAFRATLQPGESLTVVFSTQAQTHPDGDLAYAERKAYENNLLSLLPPLPPADRPVQARLALAADQFIVARPSPADPHGHTIIAGYPWFSDWGRDTMISLPGLALASGRPEIARSILRTYAQHVSQGMLPNRFPDAGEQPEYNTVDATLWYFEAIRAYVAQTGDEALLSELFPILEDIISWHRRGTRYEIRVDAADGLLRAGEEGVQLTWMDVKVDGWVVTPRTGKAVEINALWIQALRSMQEFAVRLRKAPGLYSQASERALASFARFWNPAQGYCYDVLDGPAGHDATLRPNQLIAASLPCAPLLFTPAQMRSLLTACSRALLTSHGLRTLDPADSRYRGFFGGDYRQRDSAYHQGTAWSWLIGPFIRTHLNTFADRPAARRLLLPLVMHLSEHGLGTVSEVFDGDPPHAGKGCFAQAWGVAELLRAWELTAA
jgi:predicted glycogen debranching enzyme